MKILDYLLLPLNQSTLIEASAGTGKTYTMVNLYLRLLLGVGCEPLMVEQILVVTFTKAATQELRDRIRDKVGKVSQLFQQYQQGESAELERDQFLFQLYQAVEPRLEEALLRLSIAEKEIDLAAIFTIDSFCQKMLFQFAFDSGVRFDLDLQTDESELLTRLSQEVWRELFYPMALSEVTEVAAVLKNPTQALSEVEDYLNEIPPQLTADQQWITQDFSQYLQRYQQFLAEVRAFWQENETEIVGLIENELNKKYDKGVKKAICRNSYKKTRFADWAKKVSKWAKSNQQDFPEEFERFCQEKLNASAEEGAEPLSHSLFAKNQQFLTAYQTQFQDKQKSLLLFQFLQRLQQKLAEYKQLHKEKNFNDLLSFLLHALRGESGSRLAAQIRGLFPFAMIDEFQDTNQQQYEIFRRIFMDNVDNQGFVMIGDPKQSIYRFRGADIFTYLVASQQVTEKATLANNWRSLPEVVESTNRLFAFSAESKAFPFLYEGIDFQRVQYKDTDEKLIGQATTHCYLEPVEIKSGPQQLKGIRQRLAKRCAYLIQQQLKQMERGELYLQKNGENRPLVAQDIAILVRSAKQADLIRQALLERQIASVFLSERSSVYQTQEASDLCVILQACLTPYHQGALLSALGTQLWGLTAQQIYQLKQDENEWDSWVGRFVHYQQVWQQQGILPMLHQLMMQQGIIQRLNSGENAQRRITDLLHLAELLQSAMPHLENESALLRWYRQQLANPNGQIDEQKQRLESEDSLIKVVTIHGSKGLEYPIVWLPFVALDNGGSTNSKPLMIYQDQMNKWHWQFGTASKEITQQIQQAEYAEDLRLLYVAVTRAKYQLNFILPQQFGKQWNSVSYLLSEGEIGLEAKAPSLSTAEYLIRKQLCQPTILPDEIPEDDWQSSLTQTEQVVAKQFNGIIRTREQISSFTALQAQAERLQNLSEFSSLVPLIDDALDYDRSATSFILEDGENTLTYSPYQFPHSTKVGNLLHKILELWDFSQPLEREKIITLCDTLHLSEEWIEPIQHWFTQIVSTPLAEGLFSLNQLLPHQRLNEWQFYLRLRNEKALPQLNQLLRQYAHLAPKLPRLQLFQLDGFIRGFVDCIVQVDGRFYIIDYKSNFLGHFAQDYSANNIEKVMGQYRYDLQYLLYTLAVHRYLRSRLGENYDYQRDFGGVAYLFLRAMNGETQQGIFFDKPSAILIEKMDQLFD